MRGAVEGLSVFHSGLHSKFTPPFAVGVKVGLVSSLCNGWLAAKWALSPFSHYGDVPLAF